MIAAALEAWVLLKRFWWLPIIAGPGAALLVERLDLARKDGKIAVYGATMERARAALDLSAERIRRARA